jgi:hypothetical protein
MPNLFGENFGQFLKKSVIKQNEKSKLGKLNENKNS